MTAAMGTRPKIVMRGAMGLRVDTLEAEHIALLKRRLTMTSVPYKGQPATRVQAYQESGGYLWVPRYYDHLTFWPKIKAWEWSAPPRNYAFTQQMQPDASRQQPQAIERLEAQLRRDSATIGVLPTGTGKTMIALTIASRFDTPIAVFIYSGHMIDNWVEHAQSVLGVPASDVGLVKENRCDLGKPITIISIQTALSRELPDALFKQIGFIIADEIHHYGARQWSKVINQFPAQYRLGMSADPIRDDGLDPIIRWNFGKVGFASHTRPTGERPLVCMIRYPATYHEKSFIDWKKVGERWVPDSPNALKYDKVLLKDKERNKWLVGKIIEARMKGRRILIFSRLRDHIEFLHAEFEVRWKAARASLQDDAIDAYPETSTALLWGGITTRERALASKADVIFTTHGYAREALNLTHLDTLFFATPPGNPLQPVGRLRDMGDSGRRALLVIDPVEGNDYSFKKAMRRKRAYENLGLPVRRLARKS